MDLILAGPTGGGDEHHGGPHHPERPDRIGAVLSGVEDLRLGEEIRTVEAAPAPREALLRVHTAPYLDELEAFCARGGGHLDPDTFAGAGSWEAARRAAGAGLAAVDALQRSAEGIGFVVARPPGHHAEAGRGMGFCLLNNVAVTAAALAADGHRVLVVDWDVHHGNGTQSIFWDDPRVLVVSTHQWPFYPGTGRADEVGGPGALGLTVNVPLPAGATGDVVALALDLVAAPAVAAFGADWVLVSCGFDAHRDDPLGGLALSGADFARLADTVAGFAAAPGRLVLFLEGGYDLEALRSSTRATLGALLGGDGAGDRPTAGGPGTDEVRATAGLRARAVEGSGARRR
jgi:acetoin utilization deacetylase AcuC-like enzyme